jgi:hypothetical protein
MVPGITHKKLILHFTCLAQIHKLSIVKTGFVLVIDGVCRIDRASTAFIYNAFDYRSFFIYIDFPQNGVLMYIYKLVIWPFDFWLVVGQILPVAFIARTSNLNLRYLSYRLNLFFHFFGIYYLDNRIVIFRHLLVLLLLLLRESERFVLVLFNWRVNIYFNVTACFYHLFLRNIDSFN